MDINHKNFELSFEIFPPRNLKASFKLWRTIEVLEKLNPNFISVTYGAGGSTRDLTQSAVSVIAKEYNIDVAGHLTCVGSSKKEVIDIALEYEKAGAKKIVALRGDLPIDQCMYVMITDKRFSYLGKASLLLIPLAFQNMLIFEAFQVVLILIFNLLYILKLKKL